MSRLLTRTLGVLAAAAVTTAASAGAVYDYAFTGVTNNSATDTSIAEAQMHLSVAIDNDEACFTFSNLGPEASSIVQVYFDDDLGLLDSFTGLTMSSGVSFTDGASPPNLPGGNPIGFDADFAGQATSQGGKQHNGVNPGEWVKLCYSLTGTGLIDAINSDDFRVGIHVQGFDSGGSESLVTTAVPTPSAAAAGLAGLAGLVSRRRQRC